jgi:hypothetical protein
LCGCTQPPPYVNPLEVEQLEALRISEFRFKYLKDGSIDAEKTAKAAALVRQRLIERLDSGRDGIAPEVLGSLATSAAGSLANQILCCASGLSRRAPNRPRWKGKHAIPACTCAIIIQR